MRMFSNVARISRSFCLAVILNSSLLIGVAFCQVGLQQAMVAKDQHTPNLFKMHGVVATGVSADANGVAVVKVFTDRAVANIPAQLNGVNVVVVNSGEFFSFDRLTTQEKPDSVNADAQMGNGNGNGGGPGGGGGGPGGGGGGGGSVSPQDRFDRPVPIGVSLGSTGPNFCFAGTLGCRLKATSSGGVSHYILSNNHVIANENQGDVGSDQMIQPGTLDNNCFLDFGDSIGVLFDFVPIAFNGSANSVDAAIAVTDTNNTGSATPAGEAYGQPTSNTRAAVVGERVVKYGRTTDYTFGRIDSVNVSVNVGYDAGTAFFTNQIVIRGTKPNGNGNSTFSAGGDSGSLIVHLNSNDPVGLLFAGNNSFTIANPIDAVLDAFSTSGVTFTVDDGN